MKTYQYPCLGAIIGDIVGSIYEFDNIKTTDFSYAMYGRVARVAD